MIHLKNCSFICLSKAHRDLSRFISLVGYHKLKIFGEKANFKCSVNTFFNNWDHVRQLLYPIKKLIVYLVLKLQKSKLKLATKLVQN